MWSGGLCVDSNFLWVGDIGECFVDSADRILPFLACSGNCGMTIEKCKILCFVDNSYGYAGVQAGDECWCGNNAPTNPVAQSECSMSCSGDTSQKCGGPWRMNIYSKDSVDSSSNWAPGFPVSG